MTATTKIRVRAGKNGPVHKEGGKRELDANGRDVNVITEELVLVNDTRYYRRRIATGDLVVVGDGVKS